MKTAHYVTMYDRELGMYVRISPVFNSLKDAEQFAVRYTSAKIVSR